MKKKKFLTGLGFTLIVVILSFTGACTGPAAPEETFEPVELSLTTTVPPTSSFLPQMFEPWAEAIEQRTDGRVKTKIYHSGTLLKTEDTYRGVVEGIADVAGGTLHSHSPGLFPLWEVTDLGFMIPSIEVGNRVCADLWETFPEMRAEHKDVHIFAFAISPIIELHTSKKQVQSLEDIQGMKISGAKGGTIVIELMGAVGVPLPPTEFYGAMEKGVVDGVVIPWGVIGSFKLEPVLKYHTDAHLGGNSVWFAMNLDRWNSFPPSIQQIITEESNKYPELWITATDTAASEAHSAAEELGHSTISLSAEERARWIDRAKPTWDEWAEGIEAKGLPGRAVLDETIKLVEKYSK